MIRKKEIEGENRKKGKEKGIEKRCGKNRRKDRKDRNCNISYRGRWDYD